MKHRMYKQTNRNIHWFKECWVRGCTSWAGITTLSFDWGARRRCSLPGMGGFGPWVSRGCLPYSNPAIQTSLFLKSNAQNCSVSAIAETLFHYSSFRDVTEETHKDPGNSAHLCSPSDQMFPEVLFAQVGPGLQVAQQRCLLLSQCNLEFQIQKNNPLMMCSWWRRL